MDGESGYLDYTLKTNVVLRPICVEQKFRLAVVSKVRNKNTKPLVTYHIMFRVQHGNRSTVAACFSLLPPQTG